MMGTLGREIANVELLKTINSSMFSKVLQDMSDLERLKASFIMKQQDLDPPLSVVADDVVTRYFSKSLIQPLRYYLAVNKSKKYFTEVIDEALIAEDGNLNRIKFAKMLQLFALGKISKEETARRLENFCAASKPAIWQWVALLRYQQLKKFVKLFKFVCLRELFIECQTSVLSEKLNRETEETLVVAENEAHTVEEDCALSQTFFHYTRKREDNHILKSIEDYLVSFPKNY